MRGMGSGGGAAHLVHAHPGASAAAVGHDAVVAAEGDDHCCGEAMSVDCCDGGDCQGSRQVLPLTTDVSICRLTREGEESAQKWVLHNYIRKKACQGRLITLLLSKLAHKE